MRLKDAGEISRSENKEYGAGTGEDEAGQRVPFDDRGK